MALKSVGSRKYSNVRRHLSRIYYVSCTKHHRFCDENRLSLIMTIKFETKSKMIQWLQNVFAHRSIIS